MNIKYFIAVIYSVLRRPVYLIITVVVASLMVLFSIWLSIYDFISWVMVGDIFSLAVKVKLLWSTLGAWQTNFTMASRIITSIIAILAGINFAVLIFYFHNIIKLQRAVGTSLLGIVMGFLGVGCSACGSMVLSSLIGLGSTAVVINFLPLKGYEIGILSIFLLLLAIYITVHKLQNPLVCKLEN